MRLDSTVAVVTGAAGGIGAALVSRFARERATVVAVDRVEADGIRHCDVTDAGAVRQLVDDVIAEHGRIDLFCSNAGIVTGVGLDDPDDRWHAALEVNLMAHVYAARAVVPHMLAAGRGYLLNTASAAGLLTFPGDAPYTVSKYAMTMLTLGLAAQSHPRPLAANCLWPQTMIATAAVQNIVGGDAAMAVSRKPEIMADAAHAILSYAAAQVTGKCLVDEDVLRSEGVTDFSPYRYSEAEGERLKTDLFLPGGEDA